MQILNSFPFPFWQGKCTRKWEVQCTSCNHQGYQYNLIIKVHRAIPWSLEDCQARGESPPSIKSFAANRWAGENRNPSSGASPKSHPLNHNYNSGGFSLALANRPWAQMNQLGPAYIIAMYCHYQSYSHNNQFHFHWVSWLAAFLGFVSLWGGGDKTASWELVDCCLCCGMQYH